MSKVTAAELKLAIDSLPAPDSVADTIYTVFLSNPDRALMFNKVVRGDGWEEAWHNEWAVSNPQMSTSVPANPIMSDEEFDSMVDAMQDAEQQIMLNVANSLLDDMEPDTLRTVANWCDERVERSEAVEDDEVGEWTNDMFAALFQPLVKDEINEVSPAGYTNKIDVPTLEQIQDAAYARGEAEPISQVVSPLSFVIEPIIGADVRPADVPVPFTTDEASDLIGDMAAFFFLDHESPAVLARMDEVTFDLFNSAVRPAILDALNWSESDLPRGPLDRIQDDPEEAPEFDLFESAKGIRKAAHDFNAAITKAQQDGQVVVNSSTREDGTVWINSIKLEMPL